MKKTSSPSASRRPASDLRREYRFDYSHAHHNRFAGRVRPDSIAVVLDPDVASVFRTSEAVNSLLRSVITSLPPRTRSRAQSGKKAG